MSSNREGGLLEEALTHSVIGAFYDVHRGLGFGFREYLYALALERDLVAKGHRVDREVAVMVHSRGEPLATNLEVGLLLHFGRDPTFSRVICEKHFKRHRKRDRR
jgi:hypothetical protein